MGGFSVPNAINYPSPLNAVPLDWTSEPVEGAKGIQCSIAWGVNAGPDNSVYLNMQNNATLNFSKVRAIVIDNSACGSDVEFVFPDTETTVTIPAYTPYAIIPVFTNQTQFYVVCPLGENSDVTNFMILNTLPPPLSVPTTQEQNFDVTNGINMTASGNAVLIPAGTNGTLETLTMSLSLATNAANFFEFIIEDGNGNVITSSQILQATSQVTHYPDAVSLQDIRVRFVNGLKIVWIATNVSNAIGCVSAFYREP